MKILNKKIGEGTPVLIVAELSANHLQNFALAVKTIKAMKKAGADAVKIATFTPDTLTIDCKNKYFSIHGGTPWDGTALYDLYRGVYMPWAWQPKLKNIIMDLGLAWFSTPTDKSSVDFLESLMVPAYKIASFEITDIPLIEYIAKKGKPVILSTGIATLDEIKEAVGACRKAGNDKVAILKCTSAYPAPFEEINLRTIPDMARRFKTIVGLSDHTSGIAVPIGAVAFGAKIVEKHFILKRRLGGPDASFSLEPDEFKAMVKSIRETEGAIGRVSYDITPLIKKSRVFARSLFVVEDVKKGEAFTKYNIRSIRPGYGIAPKYIGKVLGRISKKNIKRGTPLQRSFID